MEIIKYPDGTSYVSLITEQIKLNGTYTFKINSYEDLWNLNQFVDVHNNINSIPTIIIPNLIDGQADRRFNRLESSGLKLVLKFLNSMKANFKIYHPHNAEVVEALMDNVEIIDNREFISIVLSKLNNKDITPTILLPDGGAFKWGAKLADKLGLKLDVLNASKFRKDGKVDKQELPNYDFEGKDILIIDDICIYGGTFKGLATMLRERNCGKLYLAVSHLTIEDFYVLGEVTDTVFDYFDKVFTTNSKYDNYFVFKTDVGILPKNLDVIKIF